jgi:amidophosphoribosyltransferase
MANLERSLYCPETEKIQEACGVTAIYSKKGEIVSSIIPLLQDKLQHRGYDSAGMAAYVNGEVNIYVGQGYVSEIFPENFNFEEHKLVSDRAIGHNRYGTSGEGNKDDMRGSQPVVGEYKGRKLALAYNGNLPDQVRQELKLRIPEELRNSMYDTQDIANAIVSAEGNTWEERIKNGLSGIDLAYSLTILTDNGRVFGLRGPSGTWPLWYGETDNKIIFASETRAYKEENIKWKEVEPGELIEATAGGLLKRKIFKETHLLRCGLHDVYGAKEDSLIAEGITYMALRRELGRELAREHPIYADLIVGVPDTGLVIAEGYAEELGRKSTKLIGKNGKNKESKIRSFIAQNLAQTIKIIDQKFKVDELLARGKSVLLIDDSLIRGKTMGGHPEKGLKGVVVRVREAGATKVDLAVTLPKFVDGCDMGYYIRKGQLVALARDENGQYTERSAEEIARIIGADSVHFLSINGVKKVYEKILGRKNIACMTCMGQPHPLDIIKSIKLANESAGN